MKKMVGMVLAAAAGMAAWGEAYEDDNIACDDASVRCVAVGDRRVYVFTNATATATVTTKRALTLESVLLAGGGGGGSIGGGGGGGVTNLGCRLALSATETILASPGNGGGGGWTYAGGSGGATSVTFGGATHSVLGGGGGGGMYAGQSGVYDPTLVDSAGGGGGGTVTGSAGKNGHKAGNSASSIGGGGAGAGGAGGDASSTGGAGGAGVADTIAGVRTLYGGGGAGRASSGGAGCAGSDGLGTGGDGGAKGGTGAVILSFSIGDTTASQPLYVRPIAAQEIVRGGSATPNPVVTNAAGTVLIRDQNYVVTYLRNDVGGYGSAIVSGRGSYAGQCVVATFEIVEFVDDGYLQSTDDTYVSHVIGSRRVYVFTNVADVVTLRLSADMTFEEALVVAGGGGGGNGDCSGGGGGGGVLHTEDFHLLRTGDAISLRVGAGGALGYWNGAASENGGDSWLKDAAVDLTALGGGHGACGTTSGAVGGSGGGGGIYGAGVGTSGQGHRGGSGHYKGGGGGGAEEAGGDFVVLEGTSTSPTSGIGGKGGDGRWDAISGTRHCYGSGGGGSVKSSATNELGVYTFQPGSGGAEGGGHAGVYTAYSSIPGYSYAGEPGVDGLGGGGGALGHDGASSPSGRGGHGTVILAFTLGDNSQKRFAFDAFETYPIRNGAAEPDPAVRDGLTGETLVKGRDYGIAYQDNTSEGVAYFVVTGYVGTAYAALSQRHAFRATALRFVSPTGSDAADGRTWATAMSLSAAIAGLADATYDVWLKEGVYAVESPLSVAQAVSFTGGFAGDDADIAKIGTAKSTFDCGGVASCAFNIAFSATLAAAADTVVTFTRCAFADGKDRGLTKTGTSSLKLTDCDFIGNSRTGTDTQQYGGALYFSSAYGNNNPSIAQLDLVRCRFLGNVRPYDSANRGWGMVFIGGTSYGSTFEDCQFVTNGVPFGADPGGPAYLSGLSVTVYTGCPLTMRNCTFVGNRGAGSSYNNGSVFYATGRTTLDHCLFLGNEELAGVNHSNGYGCFYIAPSSASVTSTVKNCTFAYNLVDTANGSVVRNGGTGCVRIENCIFYGNRSGSSGTVARDVSVASTGKGLIRYTLFASTDPNVCYGPLDASVLTVGDGVIAGDPLFVSAPEEDWFGTTSGYLYYDGACLADLLALDVHLKSSAGYRMNGDATWHTDDDSASAGVDAGDPADGVGSEPAPNGGLINLGVYGGTDEASKTAVSDPAFEGGVAVSYPTEWTQPQLTATLGGAGAYSATVTLYWSTNGTDWVASDPFGGLHLGDSAEWLVPEYFPVGVTLYAKAQMTVGTKSVSSEVGSSPVAGKLPPWAGKGGGEGVVHVRAGATGKKDGTSWTDAFDDIHAGLNALSSTRSELWLAGTVVPKEENDSVGISLSFPAVLRGGFDGHENTVDERTNALSVIDGEDARRGLRITNTKATVVERIEFTRASDRGFCGQGGGTWSVTNCVFSKNINAATFLPGRGAYFSVDWFAKQSGTIHLRLSGCRFSENFVTNGAYGGSSENKGCALQLYRVDGVHIDNCTFVSNGIPFTATAAECQAYQHVGTALHAGSAPLTVTGCKFIANRSSSHYYGSGSVIYAPAANFRHVFTNCQFVANESVGHAGHGNYAGRAPIWLTDGNAASTADVVNCTFAYNVDARYNCGGGVSMAGGRLNVRNCIFHGNTNAATGCRYEIYRSGAGAVTDIAYTMFDATNDVYGAANVTNRFGAGVREGDPLFESSTASFGPLVTKGADKLLYLDWTKPDEILGLNVHPHGRFGYYDERTGLKVLGRRERPSPAVDAGDPASDYSREPQENHNPCIDLGCYGNTPWATLSPQVGSVLYVR